MELNAFLHSLWGMKKASSREDVRAEKVVLSRFEGDWGSMPNSSSNIDFLTDFWED